MNRKTLPVCSSTQRRRTRKDVEKRLQQIRDEYKELTDCHLPESDFEQDSGEFLEFLLPHPNYSLHFGDSDDDSEEDPPRKRYRTRPRPSPHPPAPAVPPPPVPAVQPPCRMASNGTVIYPPPTPPLQTECRRPAKQQTLSGSQVHTPNLQGGRFDSNTAPFSVTDYIIRLLEHIKDQQEKLVAKVNDLASKLDATVQEEVEIPVQFPLTSMEEVDSFENWLRDPEQSQLKQRLICSLSAIGGQDTKRITWNILAHIFHYDVGKMINWKGVNGKKSFNQMSSKTLLLQSVRENPNSCTSTDHDICKHAIRWFNLAADRAGSKRRNGTHEVQPDDQNESF